jgi:signal transduction histidine kinase
MEQFILQTEHNKLELIQTIPAINKNVFIFADADRLQQIFSNLIGNAIKFTANGSIEIGYQPKGQMIEFYVKDTGIGIPVEYQDKIFTRFIQVEAESTRKYGGNGLGLAITKSLVELMGGEIWVKSEISKGSAFYFTLPTYNGKLI